VAFEFYICGSKKRKKKTKNSMRKERERHDKTVCYWEKESE
jgi:hypothetical protein